MKLKEGYYFVICNCKRYKDAIVACEPHVILAHYFGEGVWDTELLEGEDYIVKEVVFPTIKEMEEK